MSPHEQSIRTSPSLSGILEYLEGCDFPFCYTDLVRNHIIKDVEHVEAMTKVSLGSVDYVFLQMKRILLLDQCKTELVQLIKSKAKVIDRNRCPKCNIYYYYDQAHAANVCSSCGLTIQLYGDQEIFDITNRDRYNKNPVHHYVPSEHFYQTLLDITCTSRRKVPPDVMNFCLCVLGRGSHVTHTRVFEVLQAGRYTRHYASKYEIASRLRGTPEINLSPREEGLVRMHYQRYARHMLAFQRENGLGSVNRRGRSRVYWPVRFIMAEMFKLIGRDDLVVHLKGVAGRWRAEAYTRHWRRLRVWVDRAEPMSYTASRPVVLYQVGESHQSRTRKRTNSIQ